jgi:hypothetical protein
MCTPEQIEILQKMDPYLEGLTVEQARQLAAIDVFAEGCEAGREAGKRDLKIMATVFIVLIIFALLVLISS